MWHPWKTLPTIRFPYKRYRDTLAPIIPMAVLSGHRWKRVLGFVDSGAAYSILTVSEAKRLGLLKIRARRLAVTTSGGRTVSISLHRLWVKVADHRLSITFGVPRDFDVDSNLIGRRDFFSRFEISFNDKKGILTLTPQS